VRPHPLERLLAPRAVAILGGGRGDAVGERVLRNLVAGGFKGALHAVDVPGASELPGVRVERALADVEETVDLAVIATPIAGQLDAVRACALRRVGGAVIPAGVLGASQRGGEEHAATRALLDEAARGGLRLVGPNSVGLARPGAALQATLTNGAAPAGPGGLGLVSQSGAVCAAALDWAAAHRIGFSTVVSLGDAIDVDVGEVLEYLALDPDTKAIVLYLETVRSARALLSGLRLAARIKPVVVVKSGRHALHPSLPPLGGGRVGEGGLSDDAFDAALARTGAVRVPTLRTMFAAAALLGTPRFVGGNRLAIVSNARGIGLLAADRAADLGVPVPALAPETRKRLAEILPAAARPANPVDLLGDADPERYAAAVKAVLADPNVDAVLAMLAPHAPTRPVESADAAIAAARGQRKALFGCWIGEESVREARARFVEARVPEFASPESSVEAFAILASHARNQELMRQLPGPLAPDAIPYVERARDLVRAALARKRSELTSAELHRVLAAIDVRDRNLAGQRVRGTELHVSVTRDPIFGPVIRFGRGGAPGLVGDAVAALPPLDTAIIRTLVRSSRLAALFGDGGELGPEERDAFERTLWAVSELVCEVPEVQELEIGPLVVAGSVVYAGGSRARLAWPGPGSARYDHMAIHPYPSDLVDRWELAGGVQVTVRPIRPEDAEMEASFVRNLSDHARHFRFGVAIKELTREMLVRFTQIDYDRELALLVLTEAGGEETEVAVARFARTGPDSADIAIVVGDAWQGKGLGRRLLVRLMDIARTRGIRRFEGEMLSENLPIRNLLASLGFKFHRDPEGGDIVLFEKLEEKVDAGT
jgi:acyl-CoA synthetase (NDP forming)/RimJ/RimL family protein N-acetyltransferase